MKKILSLFLVLAIAFGLTGCSAKVSSIQVQDDVDFKLVDVLEVDNKQVNTVYYYFLASVENNSDKVYHMSNLVYQLCAPSKDGYKSINPIDQFKTIITNDVNPGMSTYVYGYIGVPKTADRTIGLYVKAKDAFIPFDSVKIRTRQDDKIQNSEQKKFTVYSDEYYEFEVDAENLTYTYENGKSRIEGLNINYKNKTDSRLVIPFLSPVCTIDGFKIDSLKDPDQLKSMSLQEIASQDFSENGMAAKTEQFKCETYGYQVFYLNPDQDLSANILFEADGIIPDFSSKKKDGITVSINSPAFGYRQVMKVNY